MFSRYKELFYGVLFGVGAIAIDLLMHARISKHEFTDEVLDWQPAVLVYRTVFLAFGVALGWLLWRNNRREREFRKMQEHLARLKEQTSASTTLAYSKLQVILMRSDIELAAPETLNLLHAMRDDLKQLKSSVESVSSIPKIE